MPEITTLGSAAPGTVVASGSLITPAGDQGPAGSTGSAGPPGAAGLNAFNITSGSFTVPPVGSTVTVTLNDASWVVVGQMIYCDQAGGGVGQAGALQVTAKTGNQITLLTPTPAPAIPNASSSGAGLLAQLSGNTTDFVDGTNTCQNLVTAIQPTIWSARLRSLNCVGNPTFECDQISCGSAVANANAKTIDRWGTFKAGTMAVSAQQLAAVWTSPIVVPGTNFVISNNYLRVTLTTQEASLGTGDVLIIGQDIEGPRFRELSFDVHSVSLLVRSSVGGLKFGVSLRDTTPGKSLSKLCTIPSASTWTLITLPNLPVWPSTGSFGITPGTLGFYLNIVLAAGTSQIVPANDTWQNGSFLGALGQDNFASKPVNSTFDIAYISHEPGAQSSNPPMDCPFGQNLDGDMGCLRYFQKTYDYPTLAGSAVLPGLRCFSALTAAASAYGPASFHKPMAKIPTITIFNHSTGAANSVGDGGGVNHAGASGAFVGISGFSAVTYTGATTGPMPVYVHYTADTGW